MNFAIHVSGWSLVHFVWQGLAIAIVAAVLLRLLRLATPQARHAVACAALVAMVAAPLVTARLLMAAAPGESPAASTPTAVDFVVAGTAIAAAGTAADQAASTVGRGIATFLPLVVAVWLTGVGILLIRLSGGWLRLYRLQRASLQRIAS